MVDRIRAGELFDAVKEMVDHAKEEMTQSATDRAASATFDNVAALTASESIINAGFRELKARITKAYKGEDQQFALMQLTGMERRSYGILREQLMPIFLKTVPNQLYA